MKVNQGKTPYNWFIIGILTATFWLTVSANYDDYPTKCPKQDPLNYTVLLPHETDCDKYYACSNGRKILMHCPLMDAEGNRLYFSSKLHVCVYPEQSDCIPKTTTTEQTSRPTETTTETTTTTKKPTTTTEKPVPTTTTEKPTTTTEKPVPTTTTEKPTTTTEKPVPTTTTEAPTTMTQPSTTEESTTASDVVSTSNPPPTTVITSSTGQSTTSTGTTTNEPSITTTELPSSSTVLSTNSTSTTTEITSTTGQSTSTESTASEPPVTKTTQQSSSTVVTTDKPSTTEASTTLTPLPLCTESTTGVYLAHESYPHLYYECSYGDLIRKECEENSNFDVENQMCVGSSNVDYSEEFTESPTTIEPTNSSEISSICNPDGCNSTCERHPHECDCHKFYVCINGDAVLRICPSSLGFNPTLKECDLLENVKCGGNNGGGDNGDGNNSTNPIPTQCPPDNTGWAVQLAHETNCSLFYKCNWGEKFVLSCRPGLHFNPKLQVCDWPCSAGCTAEGGDGSNTCNSPNHPGSEKPVGENRFLRFRELGHFAYNDIHDGDDEKEDRSVNN